VVKRLIENGTSITTFPPSNPLAVGERIGGGEVLFVRISINSQFRLMNEYHECGYRYVAWGCKPQEREYKISRTLKVCDQY